MTKSVKSHTAHHATSTPHKAPTSDHPVSRLQAAYDRCLPAMAALADNDLAAVNIDVGVAITTVRGALAKIAAFRPRFAAELPALDTTPLDQLEDYALALAHAQGLYLTAVTPPEAIGQLGQEALELRDLLHSDAQAMARHALVDAQRIRGLKQGMGYRGTAFDLIGLVGVLREAWPQIEGKTPTSPAALDRAEAVADQLLGALGDREAAPAIVAALSQQRQRAFTLLFRAYDDARRAITYLRWREDDVDQIAPSLYQGRGGRAKATPAPATSGADTPSAPAMTSAPSPIAPGLPGGSPFAAN
jgi:hypothetical protein